MSQTILITGASTGIGKATAKHFHEKGWNVVATMRTPEKETELRELENVLVTRLDVQDGASIQTAVAEAIERFGSIDVLVNNAGYGAIGPMEAASTESVRRQYDVNVIGLIETTKAVLPHFRKQKSGYLVNISSVGGLVTMPLSSLYHGTKWAVEGLSESLVYELAPLGIKVKIIEPGAIATDFATRSLDFVNDEGLTEYQPGVATFQGALGSVMDEASPASLVAEVIHEAVTDGTDTLRYAAGEDAKQWIAAREATDVATFQANLREQFGF